MVAFDLDGPIFNFSKLFEMVYEKIYQEKITANPFKGDSQCYLDANYNISPDRSKTIVDICCSKELIKETPFEDGCLDILNNIFFEKTLTIITKRKYESKCIEDTILYNYLKQNLYKVYDINLIYSQDAKKSKLQHINDMYYYYFIDDRYDTCEYLRLNSVHSIIYETPVNKNLVKLFETKFPKPNVLKNWQEVSAFLTKVYGIEKGY